MIKELINLSKSNQEVAALIDRNKELLNQSTLVIKEYKTDTKLHRPVYPYMVKGSLKSNGYLYMETESLDAFFHPVSSWKKHLSNPYLKKMSGRIDFLGNIVLKVTEMGYSFIFPKRTTRFRCTNYDEGKIIIEADLIDAGTNRNQYTTKLIGDPFSNNESNRKEFMLNKEKLLKYL